jgi:hypothetical protein
MTLGHTARRRGVIRRAPDVRGRSSRHFFAHEACFR